MLKRIIVHVNILEKKKSNQQYTSRSVRSHHSEKIKSREAEG